jgi:hypothetical protein
MGLLYWKRNIKNKINKAPEVVKQNQANSLQLEAYSSQESH